MSMFLRGSKSPRLETEPSPPSPSMDDIERDLAAANHDDPVFVNRVPDDLEEVHDQWIRPRFTANTKQSERGDQKSDLDDSGEGLADRLIAHGLNLEQTKTLAEKLRRDKESLEELARSLRDEKATLESARGEAERKHEEADKATKTVRPSKRT